MSDYTRTAKYAIATYNRWGYSTGTIYGNNRRELAACVQARYMPWLKLADIERMIRPNNAE